MKRLSPFFWPLVLLLGTLIAFSALGAEAQQPASPPTSAPVSEAPLYPFGGSTRLSLLGKDVEIAFHPVLSESFTSAFHAHAPLEMGLLSGGRYAVELNPRYFYATQLAVGLDAFISQDSARAVFSAVFTIFHYINLGVIIDAGAGHQVKMLVGFGPSLGISTSAPLPPPGSIPNV